MNFRTRIMKDCFAIFAGICLMLSGGSALEAANYGYGSRTSPQGYSAPEPAPRMMLASELEGQPRQNNYFTPPAPRRRGWQTGRFEPQSPRDRGPSRSDFLRTANAETIEAGEAIGPYDEDPPPGYEASEGLTGDYRDRAAYGDGAYGDEISDGGPYCEPCSDEGGSRWDFGPITRLHEWAEKTWLFDPVKWQNFNEFGGVQAFKSPVDLGVNGNFGFHKAVNWASPLWDAKGIGFQLGGTIALSDLDGGGGVVNRRRDQYFVTTGLFRRAGCSQGLQGGAVLDYLHDEFYVNMNVLQIRSEISYVLHKHEVGVWAAVHAKSDTRPAPAFLQTPTVTWQSNDQYNLFYRYRFCNGATARTWIGLSSHSDVIFGSDATAPLSERWAIQIAYNYLWPNGNDTAIPQAVRESWGLAIGLVWYPGYKVPNACFNPYRPLFMVADNGSFMLREKN